MAVQLMSNVKIITSGNAPTTANLLPGQAAFGKINTDGKYHLYGNTGEGGGAGKVVDIVVDTYSALSEVPTLEGVLTAGSTTTLDITFDNESGNITIVGHDGVSVTDGERVLSMKAGEGFKDGGFAVLSANPDNTIDAAAATTMRGFLDVFSKAEVNAMVAGVYKVKGSADSFAELIADAEYTPVAGDVWNIATAGGTDKHGNAIKAGDNVVFTGPDKATDWDVLSGIVDLSGYYTKEEVNGIKTTLEASITAAQGAADAAQAAADAAQTAAEAAQAKADENAGKLTAIEADYMTAAKTNEAIATALTDGNYVADASYVHTDNNFTDAYKAKVDVITADGDGKSVLANDGTYHALELAVVSI